MKSKLKKIIDKYNETATLTYIIIVFIVLFLSMCFISFCESARKDNSKQYQKACELMDDKQYEEAYIELSDLNGRSDYKNTKSLLKKCKKYVAYNEAYDCLQSKHYQRAIIEFEKLKDFEDSKEKVIEAKYDLALDYYDKGYYDQAEELLLNINKRKYKDTELYLALISLKTEDINKAILYQDGCYHYDKGNYKKALDSFSYIPDYKDSSKYIKKCKTQMIKK